MSRFEIATQGWGSVAVRNGDTFLVGSGYQVTILNGAPPGTTNATVYVAATGLTTINQPLTTRADGEIPGFLDGGTYTVTISNASGSLETHQVDVAVGAVPGAHKTSHEPGGTDALSALTATSFAAGSIDGTAGTASLRTLGTGGQQACAGTDARLSDTRTPTAGSVTDATVANGAAIAYSKLNLASSIVNADVATAAAIALNKLASITAGSVLMGNASNVPTATALSGDVTVSSSGVTAIGSGKVTNTMLAGSIAYSKLSLTGAILNADLAGSIAYSKLSLANSITGSDISTVAVTQMARLGLGAAADPSVPLYVSRAGTPTASFNSTGANNAHVTIDNAGGGNQSAVMLYDAGSLSWGLLKQTDNHLNIYAQDPSKVAKFTYGGNWDGTGGGVLSRVSCNPSTFVNGSNGSRSDAINSDAANSGAYTIWNPYLSSVSWAERGSFLSFYGALVVNEVGGGGIYHEASVYEGTITNNSQGALTSTAELKLTVNSGKQGRGSVAAFLLNDANAYSSYTSTIFGAGSPWINTGARGAWIHNQSATVTGGTGLWISDAGGLWKRALVVNQASGTNVNGTDVFCLTGAGTAGFGVTVDQTTGSFNNFINLAAGTTTANGIGFGVTAGTGGGAAVTEFALFRAAANVLQLGSSGALSALGIATPGSPTSGSGVISSAFIASNGVMSIAKASGNVFSIYTAVGSTEIARFAVSAAGNITWGPGGTTAVDCTLARTGANNIKLTNTGGTFEVTGVIQADAGISIAEGQNIIVGSTTGTSFGDTSSKKIGFWGAAAITRPAAYTQTYTTATRTHSNLTSATLTDNTAGTANTTLEALTSGTVYATDVAAIRNNFADLAASNNAIIVDLTNLKQVVNQVIDDFQLMGLLA